MTAFQFACSTTNQNLLSNTSTPTPHLFSMEVLNQHNIGRSRGSLLDLWRSPFFLNMVECHMEVQVSKLR